MKNQPAFPTGIITDGKGVIIGGSNGMTLRDYFAATALTALISRADYERNSYQDIAEMAFIAADAMLVERDKNEE